jgi:hypothetical protein
MVTLKRQLKLMLATQQEVEGLCYRSPADFVMKHGKVYTPQRLPGQYDYLAPRACYGNAVIMAERHGLPYVEGYAMTALHDIPMLHAWNVDPEGRVIDTTWREAGVAYLGVEFALGRADDCTWNGNATVLSDWRRGFPLFREPWQGEPPGKVWKPSEGLIRMRRLLKRGASHAK